MSAPFQERFQWAIERTGFPLCLGLDPDPRRIPGHLGTDVTALRRFLDAIISETRHLVAAYKPNTAFFESYGAEGWAVLEELREMAGPEVLIIVDAKRGDVSHSNEAYAQALLERLQADALTVQPYLGGQALAPFCRHPGRGMFVLCATSNPSAGEVQELSVKGRPLFVEIAHQARSWSQHPNVGLVVGTTKLAALNAVLQVAPDLPLLLPGGGTQGGDTIAAWEMMKRAGATGLFNYSRSILYASSDANFAATARHEILRLQEQFVGQDLGE